MIARKGALYQDAFYTAGCLFRAGGCLLQSLFALNDQYWINEKGTAALAETFTLRPPRLSARLHACFSGLDQAAPALENAASLLAGLVEETRVLIEHHHENRED